MESGRPEDTSEQAREGQLLHGYYSNPKLERRVLTEFQQRLLRIADENDEFIIDRVREQFSISIDEPFGEGYEEELIALPESEQATPGHCDRWRHWVEPSVLLIIDQKFGFKEVTPAGANYQLRVYAIGGREKWDQTSNVVVAISQPRLPFGERVTLSAYTPEDIVTSANQLTSVRIFSRRPDAPLVPGFEQCRYCKARVDCPALTAKLQSGLAIVPALSGTVENRKADAGEIITKATDEQLEGVLSVIEMAEFVKDMARDEGRKRVAAGALKTRILGKASKTTEIVDVRRAASLLELGGHLTRDESFGCCDMGVTRVREKIRDKNKGMTWKEAEEKVETVLGPTIAHGEKKAPLKRVKALK